MKKRDESSYLEEGGRKLLPKKHQKSPPFFLFQPQIDVRGNELKNGGNDKKFRIQIEGETKNENNRMIEDNEWEIVDLNNGKYQVKMKLKDEGKYFVFVQCDGVDINSSPFQIQVLPKQRNYNEINLPNLVFGSEGNRNGQFQGPLGICVDWNDGLYVCDFKNNRIQIFNSEGKFISTFGAQGKGGGQLSSPFGIAINSKGNILVSDNNNNRIQTFDLEGRFLSTFGSEGKGNGQFKHPDGICVDLNDNIYVCDYSNNRIQIFDSKGVFISTFGSKGSGCGQFQGPWGIASNSRGNILVSDNGNHRIQIFDSKGKFISTFGSDGNDIGQFSYPRGICVDLNDNILVCDYSNHRVQIFGLIGEYITQFKVNYPTDIAIEPKTQNTIVCGFNNKILIF